MIYLDSSVLLASVFGEGRVPSDTFWNSLGLVSSRLLEYEIWNRIHAHAHRLSPAHADAARVLLDRVLMLEMSQSVLARALEPFPLAVRTLDALHLASLEHLRSQGGDVQLASFDQRMVAAARGLEISIFEL